MKRVVLITGVAGGIGAAAARVFNGAGWRVVGVDRREPQDRSGIDLFVSADIGDPGALQRIFQNLGGNQGGLDALVNNAGVQVSKPLVETTPDEWDGVMSANLRAAYLAIQFAHPLLRERAGAIVNVSSVHAVATSANIAAYAASKGGLLALTRAVAIELAPDRIRVNAVLPGAVDTPMLHAALGRGRRKDMDERQQLQDLCERTVLGRIGRPEEIGQAILFLADGDRSSFITGQALVVDGGATARLSTE